MRNKDWQRYIRQPELPLREKQVGRFLGIFSSDGSALRTHGRYLRSCFHGEHFTGPQQVRGIPDGAWFRNETIGITLEFRGLWTPVKVDDPNGCRYCDRPRRGHGQAWIDQLGVGRHGFTEPTDQQRLHRMRWRRWHDGKILLAMPDRVPFTLARGTALPC